MSEITAEAVALLEQLSDEGAKEIIAQARRLVEKEDDESWDRVVDRCADSPKLAAFFESADREIAAGLAEPLDESKF
jgi:hypothetical protein